MVNAVDQRLFMVKSTAAPAIPVPRVALKAFSVHFFDAFEVVAGEKGTAEANPHECPEGYGRQQNIDFDG